MSRADLNSDTNAIDPRVPRACIYSWDTVKPSQIPLSRHCQSMEDVKFTANNHDLPMSKSEYLVGELGSTDEDTKYTAAKPPGIES